MSGFYQRRPARTSQAEPERHFQPKRRSQGRARVVEVLHRPSGAEVSIAVVEADGLLPKLSIEATRPDGSRCVRNEFSLHELDAVERAIKACRERAGV